ncbi:MAG: hypothetical protein LLG37_06670 [Spirochaetia bacterium]|nr:hypothetical protein [Spirochaetia bacterium]
MALRDIPGNLTAKKTILSAIAGKTTGTSYIISGGENTGKNFTALQFAKVMNCLKPTADGDCCDVCANCLLIDRVLGTLDEDGLQITPHPDLQYINTDKAELVVDLVRGPLSDMNAYKPMQLKKKIMIIQDAERLNDIAANTILKELEEPNFDVVIMLIVNQMDILLPTIISRCREIEVKRASQAEIERCLKKARPDWTLQQIKEAAAFSDGRIGEAARYEEIKGKIADAAAYFMAISRKQDNVEAIFDTVKALDERYKQAKEKEKKTKKSGIARIFLVDILKLLSYIYKDYMLEKLGLKSVMRSKYGIDTAMVRDYTPKKVMKIIGLIEAASRDMSANANINILFNNLFFEIRKAGMTND